MNIVKEKQYLKFILEDNKSRVYDITTGILKENGQQVPISNIKTYFNESYDESSPLINLVYSMAHQKEEFFIYFFKKNEKWLSYPDLLSYNYNEYPDIEKLPKGYIPYLRKTNQKITKKSISIFNYENKTKSLTENEKQILKLMENKTHDRDIIYEYPLEEIKPVLKCYKVDRKEKNESTNERSLLNLCLFYPYLIKLIDTNRGTKYNFNQLANINHKQRIVEVIKKESEYYFLEDFDLQDYKIIVPHTMEDFIHEGNSQNNCVAQDGSLERVIAGYEILYFLRQKENPQKSFVTCKYDLATNKTTETRSCCNVPYENKELFNLIDSKIQEYKRKQV